MIVLKISKKSHFLQEDCFMLTGIALIGLTILFACIIHYVKHQIFEYIYFSGTAILRDLIWSILLGFVAALVVVKLVDNALWNAKQAITKPFQKTYTVSEDFSPASYTSQYITLTPGVPWSGVWYRPDLDCNWSVAARTGIYSVSGKEPEYYLTQTLEDGSTLIAYYKMEFPESDNPTVTVNSVYKFSSDQQSLTKLANTDGTSSDQDVTYTRPERESGSALPQELWGYWKDTTEYTDGNGETAEHWYLIDAFRFEELSSSDQESSYLTTGYYNDRIDQKKVDNGVEYDITLQPLDTEYTLRYYVEDDVEKIDVITNTDSSYTLIRMPNTTVTEIKKTMEARNIAPIHLRPSLLKQEMDEDEAIGYEISADQEAAYQAALAQSEATTYDDSQSILDILAQPLPSLKLQSTQETPAQENATEENATGEDFFTSYAQRAMNTVIQDPMVLQYLPGVSMITVNGKLVQAAMAIDSSGAIERSEVTQENTVLRSIYSDGTGLRSASAVVNPDSNNIAFIGSGISDETGKSQMESDELTMLMTAYYRQYLQAINEQDTSLMCEVTDAYREAIVDRISSDANQSNYYDPSQFQIEISDGAIQYADDFWDNDHTTIRFNMKVDFVAQDRSTQVSTPMTNYQTILLLWDNGMWKVDQSQFISVDEYNGNQFAEFDS